MRILIVEDNIKLADYLSQGLNDHYFIPDIAYEGQQGYYLAINTHYDLIILDVMLPYIDGWTLIQRIRQINVSVPILFLTACDAIENRVKGLELGADDYLVKPFAFVELLARIRVLLSRNTPQQPDALEVLDLKINLQTHKAIRAGKLLHLSAKEFMLLALLVSKTGEVLSRTYIAEQVWDIHFDSDTNLIDVAIKRLRDKMDKEFAIPLIHAIRGVGYVLEAR